jgi:ribosomal protein L22
MYLRRETYLSLLTTTVIFLAQSNPVVALKQTNYVVSNKKTSQLVNNGWECETKLVRNDRYLANYKVVGWSCIKGERKIDDFNEMANQCAVFDVRQQMKNSYDKSRMNPIANCQEKVIKFKDSPTDSKHIWKSSGWYKMRINNKWSEFSESKLKEICSDAVISDFDNLYIVSCPSLTSQDFYSRFQFEGKTSKDDAFIDSGNDDGKDVNEDNKRAYNDTPLPRIVNDVLTVIPLWVIPLIILLFGSGISILIFLKRKK